jgi:SAM-dependent methyltransferase
MSRAQTAFFDTIGTLYDDARPGYPAAVYELAASEGRFGPAARLLEVGAGPGVATREILDFFGLGLDVVEPGEKLCGILRDKFAGQPEVAVFNQRFEDFVPRRRYAGLFSAQAYHWVEPAVKYRKAHALLEEDGILVLFWNNYSIADPARAAAVEAVYRSYWPQSFDGVTAYDLEARRIAGRRAEIAESGYFELAASREIPRTVDLGIDDYLRLLRTFSDHNIGDPAAMAPVYEDLRAALAAFGERLPFRILVNVEIGRRRPG